MMSFWCFKTVEISREDKTDMYCGLLSYTRKLIDKICKQRKIDVTQGKKHRVVFDKGTNVKFSPTVED